MIRLLMIVLATAMILLTEGWGGGNANAQMVCDPRNSIIKQLAEKYGETRRGGGLASPTVIFEIWASEATGTWTILKTTPNGLSCVMAVGEGWQDDTGEITPIGYPV